MEGKEESRDEWWEARAYIEVDHMTTTRMDTDLEANRIWKEGGSSWQKNIWAMAFTNDGVVLAAVNSQYDASRTWISQVKIREMNARGIGSKAEKKGPRSELRSEDKGELTSRTWLEQ